MYRLLSASLLCLALAAPLGADEHQHMAQTPAAPAAQPESGVRELTAVNIEFKGTKVWVPSTFIVKKGEKVRLTLINNAPSGVHGWACDEFNIKVAVNNDEKDNKKTVEFTPTKTGLFRTYCHLHPAHIGGEILVID
jgi:nitrosocyanin